MIKNPKKLLKFFIKLFLISVVLGFIAIVILFKLGGQSDQLREGAEEFLSNISGSRAVIQNFNFLGFYPNIKMDFEDIVFQENGDPTNIVMTVDAAKFSLPFSHYILNKQTVEEFAITGLKADAGFPFARPFVLDSANIVTSEDTFEASFRFDGAYDGQSFSGGMPIERLPYKQGRELYKLGREFPFEFMTDDFQFRTTVLENKKYIHFSDVELSHGTNEPITGDVKIVVADHFKANATLYIGQTPVDVKIEQKPAANAENDESATLRIAITSKDFNIEEFQKLQDGIYAAMAFFYQKQGAFWTIDKDLLLDFAADSFRCSDGAKPLKTQYRYSKNVGWMEGDVRDSSHPCLTYLSLSLDIQNSVENLSEPEQ